MKMFIAHNRRVRMSTAVKAYILLESGETFSNVADRYAKGNHLFLNAMLRHVQNNIIPLIENRNVQELFDLLGTEYTNLQTSYYDMLDAVKGTMFKVQYHYYTSHNTKSRTMSHEVKAVSKQRAQAIAQRVLGGDAIITNTI